MAAAHAPQSDDFVDRLKKAVDVALAREDRKEIPNGSWKDNLWFPDPDERRSCCEAIVPSPSNRQALESHCRSKGHIAQLFDVPVRELKRAVLVARRTRGLEPKRDAALTKEPEFPKEGNPGLEQLLANSRAALRDAKKELQREVGRIGPLLRAEIDDEAETLDALLRTTEGLEKHLELFHTIAKLHGEAQKASTAYLQLPARRRSA